MEPLIQSLVKIILIGSLRAGTLVFSRPQFFSGHPLPYFSSPEFYSPNIIQDLSRPSPNFPDEPIASHYVPYQSPEYPPFQRPQMFPPKQHFQPSIPKNKFQKYHSPENPAQIQPTNKQQNQFQNVNQQPLQNIHYENYRPTLLNSLRSNIEPSEENFNVLRAVLRLPNYQPPSLPQPNEKLAVIIEEDKVPSPSYEESKIYLEDEYSDHDNEDLAIVNEIAKMPGYPYHYFVPVENLPNKEIEQQIHIFCPKPNHYTTNIVPSLKTPLNFLPSRFPPRIEELLVRIQNYFSTYTQQGGESSIKNGTLTNAISSSGHTQSASSNPIQAEISQPKPVVISTTDKQEESVSTNYFSNGADTFTHKIPETFVTLIPPNESVQQNTIVSELPPSDVTNGDTGSKSISVESLTSTTTANENWSSTNLPNENSMSTTASNEYPMESSTNESSVTLKRETENNSNQFSTSSAFPTESLQTESDLRDPTSQNVPENIEHSTSNNEFTGNI